MLVTIVKLGTMELKFKMIVLLTGILSTGLTAGLCFTWSNAVTPGIGRLDNLTFLKSFQAMNRAIINGKFMIVFLDQSYYSFSTRIYSRVTALAFGYFLQQRYSSL